MNETAAPVPTLLALYERDLTFGRAAKVAVFALMAGFGLHWAGQPNASAVVEVERPPVEDIIVQWAIPGGIGISVIALLIVGWRYLWIKKVFQNGVIIQGLVEDVDVYTREVSSDSATRSAFNRPTISSYYVMIRYVWQGTDKTIRRKLVLSPSFFKMYKGKETELILLESAPGRPLIRAVYLETPGVRKRRFFW